MLQSNLVEGHEYTVRSNALLSIGTELYHTDGDVLTASCPRVPTGTCRLGIGGFGSALAAVPTVVGGKRDYATATTTTTTNGDTQTD